MKENENRGKKEQNKVRDRRRKSEKERDYVNSMNRFKKTLEDTESKTKAGNEPD